MKYFFLFIFTALSITSTFAQTRVSTTEYLKTKRQSIVADFPFSPKTVMNTIEEKLEKMGYKGKDAKDFLVFKGVTLPEIGTGVYDIYFMAEKKSKKDNDNAVVTMMLSKGYENFVTEKDDETIINNAKNYLDNLKLSVTAYDLEDQIKEQESVVRKNEKKAANLIDEGQSLESKLKKLQQQIEDNKKDQADQNSEVEKQKEILDMLKGRRQG
ncbi:MAG: hypothetical protein IPJ81_12430 [Chitinophagaceae bacterium]|nr:hypothetical protein [Chitinophagaceae bacterium]